MGTYFEDRMAELRANPPKRKWFVDGPLKAPKPAPEPEPTGKIGSIYFAVAGEHVKIGFATDVGSRMQSLRTGNHQTIRIEESFTSYQAAEKLLHKHFKADRVRGEWFKLTYEIEELMADIWDYQGMTTTAEDPDAPGSGREYLDKMPKTFIPLPHLQKMLDYLGKPWPADLFAA